MHMYARPRQRRWSLPLAILCTVLLTQTAHAQQVFDEVKAVGREVMTTMLWVSSIVAVLGFMAAGHAFSSGYVERGKYLLRGTLIGATCIFSAAGLVQFIRAKFSQPVF